MAQSDPTDLSDLKRRMEGALQTLKQEFAGLRTGRATASMLEPVQVEVYGNVMPITQLGTISVPEPRTLSVQVWDRSTVGAVEKAIRSSGLGLNPSTDGQLIRVPIPELNQERRAELTKVAGKYSEQARIAVRNVRRDGIERVKKAEKDVPIGKDDVKRLTDEIDKLTHRFVEEIDAALAAKEKDIMQV